METLKKRFCTPRQPLWSPGPLGLQGASQPRARRRAPGASGASGAAAAEAGGAGGEDDERGFGDGRRCFFKNMSFLMLKTNSDVLVSGFLVDFCESLSQNGQETVWECGWLFDFVVPNKPNSTGFLKAAENSKFFTRGFESERSPCPSFLI